MVDKTQSPLAMLVLVTPYTILYIINELFLHGVLDKIHYLFFELIFVAAFGRVFGIPDIIDRFLPRNPIAIHTVEGIQPIKTKIAVPSSSEGSLKSTTVCATLATNLTGPVGSNGSVKDINPDDHDENQDEEETIIINKTSQVGPYTKQLEEMETRFMDYLSNNEIWEKVYEDSSIKVTKDGNSLPWIQVHQYKKRPMCYKIIAYMNNTAAVTFDSLGELERRMEWDPLCVEAKVLENVAQHPGTTIQYVRTKAVWPTASRDTVALGTVKDLGTQGMLMINSSIQHPSMPERVKENIVRMETAVTGHIITPEEDGTRCKLVQVIDADLKGWIPDKVIQIVSTKAVPDGLRAINDLIRNAAPYAESRILSKAAQQQKQIKPKTFKRGILDKQDPNDMDPVEVELASDNKSMNLIESNSIESVSKSNSKHTLRRQRSIEEDISLSNLSDRLKVVETEIENERSRRSKGSEIESSRGKESRSASGNAGALSKPKNSNMFGEIWETIKENVRHSFTGKANKIIVAVLIIAVFGLNITKFKKR